jgi:chromosome segregation protein
VRLKSLTLKGFKSFPERTRLDFGPGVSVVVGPNGSGKSNVTDAVLWAMGEQSPLAVRGSSMQDVIFGGGRGVKARSSAEVEIVLDNADGAIDLPLSEISIVRRLDRTGEGEYRLNGARCRLTDVIEVLSDTGLGKETHSVISQGRVEAIVTSKPRDRRLLIEEAAGLGKHRKRRRRAQLKLVRTQDNLDRALDVEREARTHLRPLKRQAEAAELHERLERQSLEARLELALEALLDRRERLAAAETEVRQTRERRELSQRELEEVVARRGAAERALAERVERREQLARELYGTRSADERVQMRIELCRSSAATLTQRLDRTERELSRIHNTLQRADEQRAAATHSQRVEQLEQELASLECQRERRLEGEIEDLRSELQRTLAHIGEVERSLTEAQQARQLAAQDAEDARQHLRQAEAEVHSARREAARVGAELAAVNQFLRNHTHPARAGIAAERARLLSDSLQVKPGYELALAAALGRRLDAVLARDLKDAEELLDLAGPDGATVLLAGAAAEQGQHPDTDRRPAASGTPPTATATALLDLLDGPAAVLDLARRLLGDAWIIERLTDLPADFQGIAVTAAGRVLFASSGEVRQTTEGGSERVLASRNERERLISQSERALAAEHAAKEHSEQMLVQLAAAEQAHADAERALRDTDRERVEAQEAHRRAQWLIEQRRNMPEQGPDAVRRAQIEGELAAERRQTERIEREAREQAARAENLAALQDSDRELLPAAERLGHVLQALSVTLSERVSELERRLSEDRAAGDQMTGELRACAARESEIQVRLQSEGETVTTAEVAAQRLRDQSEEAQLELAEITERLELPPPALEQAQRLEEEQAQGLRARVERLARRREALGPVNPLAQEEYAQALEHVEELEARRTDLEIALRELRNLIRDTDRQIHQTFQETFQRAAENFSELVTHVFPGGSGSLRLVADEQTPRPVLGGEELPQDGEEHDQGEEQPETEDIEGVEIEVTPAGKSTKRLSLLSGGEKSMTALAFLFAVFLARPCPFYILDEVEAALDDLNLDRFLTLLRRYAGQAQFIVITHQKRTMEAADWLYGVSMGSDGVSKVISRRLPPAQVPAEESAEEPQAALGA